MATALVLGANGQDGSFAVEALLAAGHQVVAVGRTGQWRYQPSPALDYRALDLRDADALERLIDAVEPDYVLHAAAVHGSAGTPYEAIWRDMLAVNVATVHVVLEYLRRRPAARLAYLSSVKVFGSLPRRVGIATTRNGRCLYATTKIAATAAIQHYRDLHRVQAAVLIAFNHDSERRPAGYLLPTLADALVAARRDPDHVIEVGTLDFHCVWADAREVAAVAVSMLEQGVGGEFLVAGPRAWWARRMAETVFRRHGLELARHVRERGGQGQAAYSVDRSPLRRAIGWLPSTSIVEVMERLVVQRAGVSGIPAAPVAC
jgi:GDPmannose 4,6-dehydratase